MRFILNILWFVLGGIWMGLAWWVGAAVMLLSIIGIPFARSCFEIGSFVFWPFGRDAVDRKVANRGRGDIGTGILGTIANIVWFLLFGWWLALGHVVAAIANALTIVGIPFAYVHLKLVPISLMPVGKKIVSTS